MTITNAMRLLRQANIPFDTSEYEVDESDLSGVHAAAQLGVEPDCVFKTLVARGGKGGLYVFVIPVAEELDLKKCAAAVGEKKVEMIHVKELLGLTGYIRGGCSPIGMKKAFPTYIHEVPHLYRRDRHAVRQDLRQRGPARPAADPGPGGPAALHRRDFCGFDQAITGGYSHDPAHRDVQDQGRVQRRDSPTG